jgi:beta-lactamase class A
MKGKRSFSSKRARRQRVRALVLLAVFAAACVAAYFSVRSAWNEDAAPAGEGYHQLAQDPTTVPPSAPDPPELTLAGHAYRSVADELPDISPDSIFYAHRSVFDPSWASVRVEAPERKNGHYYALFLRKEGEDWRVSRSVLVEDQEFPQDVKTLLGGIPADLVNPLFPPDDAPEPAKEPEDRAEQILRQATGQDDWEAAEAESREEFHRVRVAHEGASTEVYLEGSGDGLEVVAVGTGLTEAEAPGFPPALIEPAVMAAPSPARFAPPEAVYEGAVDRERVQRGVEEARRAIQGYPGIAGFYALDPQSDAGYGVRPDEVFFSASTIKIPVMVAVYRKIDAGELAYSDAFETTEEDWAAGAGWLRWDTPGARTTVEDSLWLMMTQSDNVATNALVRQVGGPEYVNKVARSLGARDTVLSQKLSSERAAVPSQDNRTTPRDMALMMEEILEKRAASDFACEEMIGLLEQNNLEFWMEAGVPEGTKVANKAGWLDAAYNDVGIVRHGDRPYILAAFTKYGSGGMERGQQALMEVSEAAWLAQTGKTVEQYEKEQKEKREKELEKQRREAQERDRRADDADPRER